MGVDGCRRGWIGIASDRRAYFGVTIADLVDRAERDGTLAAVGIDIPIGLATNTPREADRLARRELGRRASSVFSTPVRAALVEDDYAIASAKSRALTGLGISKQAHALRWKILETDAWARDAAMTVAEVHPEVSFMALAGRPLRHAKTTWAGLEERRAILAGVGLAPEGELGDAGRFGAPDDVLDAAVVCWSAARIAAGTARLLPDPPERFGDDPLTAAIHV